MPEANPFFIVKFGLVFIKSNRFRLDWPAQARVSSCI